MTETKQDIQALIDQLDEGYVAAKAKRHEARMVLTSYLVIWAGYLAFAVWDKAKYGNGNFRAHVISIGLLLGLFLLSLFRKEGSVRKLWIQLRCLDPEHDSKRAELQAKLDALD